ncbi:MAG: peptidase M54 [Methanolinea sp.]|nr:peptidase M54 [Methanolinea sp.]
MQASFCREIASLLPAKPRVCENPLVLTGFRHSRDQTDASTLLDSLELFKKRAGLSVPVLLVVSVDIFREGDEYLFGLARFQSGTAVVSTTRLENEHYGLPPDDHELLDRLVKTAVHEIGHLLSLPHCRDPACIMYNPLTLDDLTRQKRWFCPRCREQIGSRE